MVSAGDEGQLKSVPSGCNGVTVDGAVVLKQAFIGGVEHRPPVARIASSFAEKGGTP
jgi:hypothetical protein